MICVIVVLLLLIPIRVGIRAYGPAQVNEALDAATLPEWGALVALAVLFSLALAL